MSALPDSIVTPVSAINYRTPPDSVVEFGAANDRYRLNVTDRFLVEGKVLSLLKTG